MNAFLGNQCIKPTVAYVLGSQGCNLVRNTRREMYGDDKFRAIELKYGNGPKADNFLMFSLYWCDEDGPQRILDLHFIDEWLCYVYN